MASRRNARFVFENVTSAIGGLQAAIRDLRRNNVNGPLDSTISTIESAINSLVEIMASVSQNRIDQAVAAGGNQTDIDRANSRMVMAGSTNNPHVALLQYFQAGKRADRA